LRSRRHTIQELPQMYRAIDLLLDYVRYEKALAENDEASFALSFNTELDAVITGEVKKVGYPSLAVQQIAQEQNILSLYSGISAAARAAVAVLADIPKSGLDLDGKSFNKLNEIATKLKEIDANHFLEENEKTLDKILELFNLVPTSQYQYIANLQEHLTALVNQIKPEEQAKLIAERLELLKEINRPDLLAFREYLAKDAVRGSAQSARAAFIEGLFSEIRNPTLRQSLDNKQIDIYRVLLPVLFLVCNAEANNPLDPILREMLRGFNVTEESIANRFSGTEVNTYFAQLQKNIFTIEQTADFSQRKSAGLFSAKHNSALIDFYLSNLTRFYQLQLDMAELTDADTQLVAELTTELTGLMSKYLSGESDQNAIQSLSDDYFRFIEDRLNPAFTDPKKALSIKPFLPFIQGELRYIKDNFRIQPTQCPDAVVVARQADEKAKCVIS
ncbi:MAG: hypothetical protein KDH94_06120, partial [Coxiellaceae bacterium]|nr:hypothetical protein [Coxiellaceae bacterium]